MFQLRGRETWRSCHRCRVCDTTSSSALQSEFYALTTDGAHDIRTENVCVPSKDKEAHLGTKYLDRDRIKRCVTRMEMMFTGAWAGKQLPAVSGTGVMIGEDLIESQSWTIGVVLLVTVGMVLLSCACIVRYSFLPTGKTATREPEVARQPSCVTPRSMRAEIINHVKERQDSLVQFLRRIATMSEDQVKCIHTSRVCGEFFRLGCRLRWLLVRIQALESRSHPHSGPQRRADRRGWRREELLTRWNTELCFRVARQRVNSWG